MPTEHEIKINLPGLLKMLGSNIYAEPDVAVREMIQNAHDTCVIRTTEDPSLAPRIDVSYDSAARTLTFADNGMGMTEPELHEYLSTIGQGFTKIRREALRGANAQEALSLIGQFGIGLLSAFSVSERVEVYTRTWRGSSPGLKWVCEGDIHYTIEPTEVEQPGTRVVLHVNASSLVLLNDVRLRQAIKKYADFLSIPVYLKGAQVNSCIQPWADDSQTDHAQYIKDRYDLLALVVLPFQLSAPIALEGLLFVPMVSFELTRDFGELDIYISRMFIKANDRTLLPPWARFVKGIINSSALMPTVSRDEVVKDETAAAVSIVIGKLIIDFLNRLEKESPDTLATVIRLYNNTIKARSLEDDDFFDQIADLVRMTTTEGTLSIREYLSRSKGILYFFSERGTATQHNLLFAQKGLPVIDASWGVEQDFLEKYAARRAVKLERLEADSGIIFRAPARSDEKWLDLERQFRIHLEREARAVAFEPNTVPALLVARPIERGDKELAQVRSVEKSVGLHSGAIESLFKKLADKRSAREATIPSILQLNTTNSLILQLRDMNRNETFRLAMGAIYNNATMFAQHYISPEDADLIFKTNNSVISAMIADAHEMEQLRSTSARMEVELSELKRKSSNAKWASVRSCFFAFDYKVEENFFLMQELKRYLSAPRLGIELIAPASDMHDLNILKSMYDQLASAHFGIAEITGDNPNVFYEAGLLKGIGRPVILLKKQGAEAKIPFDIFSDYRIEYEVKRRAGQVKYLWLEDELDKVMKTIFKMVPELELANKAVE
jgi:molecular chaperone HtpG